MGSRERNSRLVQGRGREGMQSKEMGQAIGGAWVGGTPQGEGCKCEAGVSQATLKPAPMLTQ